MVKEGGNPEEIIKSKGLEKIKRWKSIETHCLEIIKNNY